MARRMGSPLGAQVRDAFMLARLLDNEREAVEALRQMSAREYHEAIATHPDRPPLSQATKDLLCVAGCGLDETPQFEDDEETVSEYGSERTHDEESELEAMGYSAQGAGNGRADPYAAGRASSGGGGDDCGDNVGNDHRGNTGGGYSDHGGDYAVQGTGKDRTSLCVDGRAHGGCRYGDGSGDNIETDSFGNDSVGNDGFANDSFGTDNVGNIIFGNDRCGNDGEECTDGEVEIVPPPPPHLRRSGPKDMAFAKSTRNRQNSGNGHRRSKGGRANKSAAPGSEGSRGGNRSGNGGGGDGGGSGTGNVYREPIRGRTPASRPSRCRSATSVAARTPLASTSTVETPAAATPDAAAAPATAAAAAAGTGMAVSRRAKAAMPSMGAGAAAAPTPSAAGLAAGGAAATPKATNNLPCANAVFIDDAEWRFRFMGGVPHPPLRRAAEKAMDKIAEISVAAATGPASPRRQSSRRSGGGRSGAASRDATSVYGFASSARVDSQRRHSISGGGCCGGGGGGGGSVDPTGAIVPQKRPGSPMQGPISIQARGRNGTGEVSLSFELDPRLFLYMAPGACPKKGCVFVREAHCHRGPAYDCVRNRDAYTIPRETARILEHQNEHIARNANPAVGKRVLVKFSDDVWYKGTITARKKRSSSSAAAAAAPATTSAGASGTDGYRDKWQIVFDDTDTRTFYTGDPEVMISNQPQPHNLPAEVKALYRKSGNGRALLMPDTKARAAALAEINARSDGGTSTSRGALPTSSPPPAVPEARKQRCRLR